jgi:hypothetical protein
VRSAEPGTRTVVRDGRPLGLGCRVGRVLVVPLHVLDRTLLADQGITVLAGDGRSVPSTAISVVAEVPAADALVCCDPFPPGGTEATWSTHVPDDVEVAGPGQAGRFRMSVRARVDVRRYSYRSADGSTVGPYSARLFVLNRPVGRGTSGAPVYVPGTSHVVGLIHGNVADFGGNASFLDASSLSHQGR